MVVRQKWFKVYLFLFLGVSPLTPDVSSDRLLAKEMEKIDKEVQRLREQHEFELLRVRLF